MLTRRLSLQEFVPVARELEKNWTRFTPHYIVWVCPRVYRKSEECQSQCIHQGRYCTPDPDGDLQNGYSGRDVVQVRGPQFFHHPSCTCRFCNPLLLYMGSEGLVLAMIGHDHLLLLLVPILPPCIITFCGMLRKFCGLWAICC